MVDRINPAQKMLEIVMDKMTPEEYAKKLEADPTNPTLLLIRDLFMTTPTEVIIQAAANVEVKKLADKFSKLADDIHQLNENWKP